MLSKYMQRIVRQGEKIGYNFALESTVTSYLKTFIDWNGNKVFFQSWASASRFFTNPARLNERRRRYETINQEEVSKA